MIFDWIFSFRKLKEKVDLDTFKFDGGFFFGMMALVWFQGMIPRGFNHRIYLYIIGFIASKIIVKRKFLTFFRLLFNWLISLE